MPLAGVFDAINGASWEQARGRLVDGLAQLQSSLDRILNSSHNADGTLNTTTAAAFKKAPIILTTTAVGTQDNFDLRAANGADVLLRCNNATLLTLTGFTGGQPGQQITVVGIGAGDVAFTHQAATSAGPARLWLMVQSAPMRMVGVSSDVTQRGLITLIYDGNGSSNNAGVAFWRCVAFDQGAFRTTAFSAGDFVGSGAMTWTVGSGDVQDLAYYLRGRLITVSFGLVTTSVGGGLDTDLRIHSNQWGGFTTPTYGTFTQNTCLVNDNGTRSVGRAYIGNNQVQINIAKYPVANYAGAANTTDVLGELTFEVS